MKFTLSSADDLKSLMTWVDAAFAVHPDMKSHILEEQHLWAEESLCRNPLNKN